MSNVFRINLRTSYVILMFMGLCSWVVTEAQVPQHALVNQNPNANGTPFNSTTNQREWLFKPSDFPAAPSGFIQTIYVKASAFVTTNLSNLRVQMGSTQLGSLSAGPWITDGLTTVADIASFSTTSIIDNWIPIPLQKPYYYDNTSNFLVLISQGAYAPGFNVIQGTVPARSLIGTSASATATVQDRLGDFGFDLITASAPYDAGVFKITHPSSPSLPGTFDVKLQIKNYGTDTLYSASILWSVNGVVQNPYTWTGLLPSDSSSSSINIGNLYFPHGQHIIKAWTSYPNGSVDTLNYNDTVHLMLNMCNVLSGTYTVGGGVADFSSIQAAIDTMALCGVAGAVTLNILPGIYEEQVTIPYIPGSSVSNRILIQSATGIPSDVVIRHSASQTNNYTLMLDGADFIDIHKLTIEADHSAYARVLVLSSGANENTISGCFLWTNPLARTSTTSAGIYSSPGSDHQNIIENNHISNGYYGIQLLGSTVSDLAVGNVISQNMLVSFFARGIYCEYQKSLVIEGNTLKNHGGSIDVHGISLTACLEETRVLKNRIQVSGSGTVYGISCTNNEAISGANPALYVNNLVAASGTNGTVYGIHLQSSAYQAWYHNSVTIMGNNGNNRAASFVNGAENESVNNIYTNRGGGYAVHITGTPLASANYNNFFTVATHLGYYGSPLQTLADLQLATGKESNSVNLDPGFTASILLYPTNPSLDNKGTPLLMVQDDVNGLVRSQLTPDVGAVEFSIDSIDAGISMVHGFDSQIGSGIHDIKVTIRNYGLTNLTAATIYYAVNNANPVSYLWTGNLSSGNEQGPITLGSVNFPVGIHRLKVWTSQPNNFNDLNFWNDTMEVIIDVCESFSGTYTIGPIGSGADYVDFATALSGLSRCLVSGPTVFQVFPGVYNEQVTIKSFDGVSSNHTLTFQSSTGIPSDVTIAFQATGSVDNWVLRLDGASYVTFKNMTFKTASSTATYGRVIELVNAARYNTITGNIIESVPGASSNNTAGIYSGTTKDEYNMIINNTIRNGYYGIYLYGPSSTNLEEGNLVENNIIEDFSSYGLYQQNQRNLMCTRNTLSSASNSTSVYGMRIYHVYEGSLITKNRINLAGSGTSYGLYTHNVFGNAANPVILANNFVAQSVSSTGNVYAAQITNASYVRYYHNSFNMLSSANNYGIYITTGNSNIEFVNNMVVRANGGYAIYGTLSALQSLTLCDYNNYYSSGSSLAYAGAAISNLAAWQTATGLDAHSVSLNPAYLSTSSLYPTNYALNNLGTFVAAVSDDIDDAIRNTTTPDIGAVEFEPPVQDIGVSTLYSPALSITSGMHDIIAAFKNYGNGNLNSANIHWCIDGGNIVNYVWNGSLGAGLESGPINLGSYHFVNGQALLKIWTSSPNGYPDGFLLNDTLSVLISICDLLQGTYTIGASSADFSSVSDAITAMQACGVSGPVIFNIQPGIYNEQVTIGEILGAADTNTITFQSITGNPSDAVIQYHASAAAQNWVWRFNGADHIVLKDLTLRTASSTGSYGRVIELLGGAQHNKIIGNILQGKAGITDNNAAVIYSNALSNDYNLIKGNQISGGSHGIYFATSSISNLLLGNVIDSNQIVNWWYYGIFAYGHDAIMLTSNFIENAPGANIVYGLYCSYCDNGIKVMYNHVRTSGTGNNWCFNIYYCDATASDPGLVANNVIHQTSSTSGTVYGLRAYNSSHQRYYHNTIKVNSTSAGYPLFYYGTLPGNKIINNLFANTGGSLVININSLSYLSSIDSMDHNNYYTSGSVFGYLAAAIPDFSAWKTASGFDVNSVSVDPWFLTPDDTKPHAAAMNNLGVPLTDVVDDFYGYPRHPLTPDLGAIEFDPILTEVANLGFNQPISGCDLGLETVSIRIHNTGMTDIVGGLKAGYCISGSSIIHTDSITTPIPAGDTLLYQFSQAVDLTVMHDTSLNLISWVILPGDPVPSNDTSWHTIGSFLSPPPPLVANTTIPYGGMATLEILNPDNQLYYYWYDVPVGGNFLAIDTVFTTPMLYSTTVYYVESTNGIGNASLTTLMFGGHAQGGYMFDISSVNPVSIDSFYVNTQNSGIVSVYYKLGTYLDYEEKPNAWTYLGSASITAAGAGNFTLVDIGGFHLSPGMSYGFYISLTSSTLIGSQVTQGYNYFSDGNLSVTAGTGIIYPFTATGNLSIFNGKVHYSAGNGCVSPRVPDTVFVQAPALIVGAGQDVFICQGDTVQLNAIVSGGMPPYTYNWSPDSSLNIHDLPSPMAFPMVSTIYTLIVTDQNAQTGTAQVEVVVQSPPLVTFPLLPNVYVTDPAFPLTGGTPSGGTYAGPGVSAGMFDPALAGVGSHTLTYTYTDPVTTCSGSATSEIVVESVIGMPDFSQGAGMRIYPNPSSGKVHITLPQLPIEAQLELVDNQGKVVEQWIDLQSDTEFEVDLRNMPKGIYLLRLSGASGKFQQKLILQ